MPTYEYRCDECDRNFDVVQSFEDDPLTRCPTCDAPVRKVFGSVGIVFKGAGFYKTDSRDSSRRKDAPRTEGADAKAGTSDSSDKGSGPDSSPSGGGAAGGDQKSSPSSGESNGKSPASTTSNSS
ncbi:MAG: FmdB family zinc ribbon protein [Acidimicrobiales bacterium]